MLDPSIVKLQVENLRLQHGELEADEEAWLLALESETSLDELLTKLVERLDETAILSGGLQTRITELELRQARFAQRQRSIRQAILGLMQGAGVPKKELPLATLSVRKGSQHVVILDEASVPDVLCKITRTPDKAKVKELLLNGSAPNWAHMETGEPSLMIRVK